MFSSVKKKIKKRKTVFEKFLTKNKSRISITVFFSGFIFDIFTLTKIDAFLGNMILLGYLFLALFSIILMNWGDYKDIKNFIFYKFYQYSPFITQFSFGALFSGFVVYYTTSGTVVGSWPFLLILYLIFIANEKVKKHYEKFEFQISVFFVSFLSLSIYFLPILSKKVGDDIFIASGGIAVFLSFWIIKWIFKILPILKKKKNKIIINFFVVFFIFNIAYFFQVIPPVPLSIKKIEVAHMIERNNNGNYLITKEIRKWYNFYDLWNNTFYKKNDEKVYVFSSVFAPKNLETKIFHHWEFFDIEKKKWITVQKIEHKITGGRNGGYRTYSILSKVKNGEWRVSVKNNSGFLIGREKFLIINGKKKFDLKTEIFK